MYINGKYIQGYTGRIPQFLRRLLYSLFRQLVEIDLKSFLIEPVCLNRLLLFAKSLVASSFNRGCVFHIMRIEAIFSNLVHIF